MSEHAEYDSQPGRVAPQHPELTHAERDANEDDLYAGLSGLAEMVTGARSVDELLIEVASFAAHAIPGVDGAGVTVLHPAEVRPRIEAWAVTAEFVQHIDTLQYDVHHEGPCLTSMHTRRPCVSGSIGEDERWPRFGEGVAHLGVNSALSLPLVIGEQVVGAINAYAYSLDAFAEYAVSMGTKFAGPAAVSVYNTQLLTRARERAEQLQRALVSRTIIDQAIGIVRSRSGGNADEAFTRLIKISQAENVKLHVVAERLVDEAARRARARRGQSLSYGAVFSVVIAARIAERQSGWVISRRETSVR